MYEGCDGVINLLIIYALYHVPETKDKLNFTGCKFLSVY